MDDFEVEASIVDKVTEACNLANSFFSEHRRHIVTCAKSINERLINGGRVFLMGNGGSACDAAHMTVEFMHPIIDKRHPIPAYCLSNDQVMMSAVGNDQDYSMTFFQQLKPLLLPGDIVIAYSTSGNAANVLRAMQYAKELKALTVGILGKDGGRAAPICDFSFVVPSYSIHRIQEMHVKLLHLLWDSIHLLRGEEDVT